MCPFEKEQIFRGSEVLSVLTDSIENKLGSWLGPIYFVATFSIFLTVMICKFNLDRMPAFICSINTTNDDGTFVYLYVNCKQVLKPLDIAVMVK